MSRMAYGQRGLYLDETYRVFLMGQGRAGQGRLADTELIPRLVGDCDELGQ